MGGAKPSGTGQVKGGRRLYREEGRKKKALVKNRRKGRKIRGNQERGKKTIVCTGFKNLL